MVFVPVNVSLAGLIGKPEMYCNSSLQDHQFTYAVYHRYLAERNFDSDYFLTALAETMLLKVLSKYSLVAKPRN